MLQRLLFCLLWSAFFLLNKERSCAYKGPPGEAYACGSM
jgi:hypothetical protein